MRRFLLFVFYNFKMIFLLIAGIMLTGMMCSRLFVSLTEHTPAPVHLDNWAAEYHGQRWIRLTGIAKLESSGESDEGVFIPMVPSNYRRGDIIHAVIIAKPGLVPRSGPITVDGYDVDRNLSVWLPQLKFDRNPVCLLIGERPEDIRFAIAFFLICFGCCTSKPPNSLLISLIFFLKSINSLTSISPLFIFD